MFTSANVAAARLSVFENEACFAGADQIDHAASHRGPQLLKGSKSNQLGASLLSVAALISKLDEDQPSTYESRSSPTLRLQPLRKSDEALKFFLERVEAARLKDVKTDVVVVEPQSWAPETAEISRFEETQTLDNVPVQILETRRSAYKTLAKRTFSYLNFERADGKTFDTSLEQIMLKVQPPRVAERVLIRSVDGVAFHSQGWTLSIADDKDPASLLKACRTAAEVKITFQTDSQFNEYQDLSFCKNQLLLESNSLSSGSAEKTIPTNDLAGEFITRLISELLEVAGSHEAENDQVTEAFSLLEMSLCTGTETYGNSPVNVMDAVMVMSLRHQ